MNILIDDLSNNQNATVPGYFVFSTAPINIEDNERKLDLEDNRQQNRQGMQALEDGVDRVPPTIADVIEKLYQNTKSGSNTLDLVIQIHGYNTGSTEVVDSDGGKVVVKDGIRDAWVRVCEYLNQDSAITSQSNSFVYLGYRWPSESVPSSLRAAVRATPLLLGGLCTAGLAITVFSLIFLIHSASHLVEFLLALAVSVGIFLFTLGASLFILRIIVYFRDAYRANNFAVPDLTEFIRQLDQGLLKREIDDLLFKEVQQIVGQDSQIEPTLLAKVVRKTWEALETQQALISDRNDDQFRLLLPLLKRGSLARLDNSVFLRIYAAFFAVEKPQYTEYDYETAQKVWENKRIKLSFVGHSMGAFVTTQTIRILSDAFDPSSIGSPNSLNKSPLATIGRVFSLGRLILVSPDIPVKTIISGRANFLRSSLRRFEEAYLFSNEGDLALRLASTAANYFSYPAGTRTQGYRLGNVTVDLNDRNVYGIVNLTKLKELSQQPGKQIDHLLQYIGIKVLNHKEQSLEPSKKTDQKSLSAGGRDPESIADLFTYLDCTEYQDKTDYVGSTKARNVLICNGQKSPLNLLSYFKLTAAYIRFSVKPSLGVDVHGGYFYGHFSKKMIYRLAFLGFEGLLDSLVSELNTETGNLPDPLKQAKTMLRQRNEMNQGDEIQKRRIALEYFDWLCKTKLIQVALSSERYYAEVLSKPGNIRHVILTSRRGIVKLSD